MKRTIITMALLALAGTASAQVASNSNATSQSASGSSSSNEGVSTVYNANASGENHVSGDTSLHAQVPLSQVLYGSFSQASCMSGIGAGFSTSRFSMQLGGPKADTSCQHVILADSFGRASQLKYTQGDKPGAAREAIMVDYANCTSSTEDMKQACIDEGLVILRGNGRNKDGTLAIAPRQLVPAPIISHGGGVAGQENTAEVIAYKADDQQVTVSTAHSAEWTSVAGTH